MLPPGVLPSRVRPPTAPVPASPYLPIEAPAAWTDARIETLGSGQPVVFDGVLGSPVVNEVRDHVLQAREAGRLQPGGVGRGRAEHPQVRSDVTGWFDDEAPAAVVPLLRRFEELRVEVSEAAYLGLGRFEVQMAVYAAGCGYERHRDALRGRAGRRLTAIYYANPAWTPADGGQLEVFGADGASQRIDPIGDRLVVFLSEQVEHRVLPVTGSPRVAVTAWYWGRSHA